MFVVILLRVSVRVCSNVCFACEVLCDRVRVSRAVCLCLCACLLLSVFMSFVIESCNVMMYGLFVCVVLGVCVVCFWLVV